MSKNKTYDKMLNDITQAELKVMFDYDAENGWLIRKFRKGKPYNKPCGYKPAGYNGYGRIKIKGKMYHTHRLIWLFHYGEFPSEFIDHIDGNRVNNRVENLREVDNKSNCHNRKVNENNTSGFADVVWDKEFQKYRVRIEIDGNRKHIGRYGTIEDAVLASKKAKIKYHPSSPDAKKYADELGIEL